MARWIPELLRGASVSAPSLWGKLPNQGDFLRYQVKHGQSEALQAWISAHLQAASPALDVAQEKPLTEAAQRRPAQESKWSRLTPIELQPGQTGSPTTAAASDGHPTLPWCFVLAPGSLPFASKAHVIGVWMNSSDKFGRVYPLLMTQTASPRWIRQYFAAHAQQPYDWLFAAARALAHAVYTAETALDSPAHAHAQQAAATQPMALVTQLEQLWRLQEPSWPGWLSRFQTVQAVPMAQLQRFIPTPHAEDPVPRLHGVRYLPWADWPQRLLGEGIDGTPCSAFWQQDLQGRYVAALTSLQELV